MPNKKFSSLASPHYCKQVKIKKLSHWVWVMWPITSWQDSSILQFPNQGCWIRKSRWGRRSNIRLKWRPFLTTWCSLSRYGKSTVKIDSENKGSHFMKICTTSLGRLKLWHTIFQRVFSLTPILFNIRRQYWFVLWSQFQSKSSCKLK